MTDHIRARRTRLGFTRTRLAILVIAVLGLAGGAAAYAMKPPPLPASQAEAESRPSASAEPAPPSAIPQPVESASPRPLTVTAGTMAPQQRKSHAADSAVDPDSVFIDPAAAVTSAAQWDGSSPATCGRWRDLLSGRQQTSYATALLRLAWQNYGSSASPAEATVRSYRSAITAACLGKGKADDNVSDVARVIYAANPGKWVP
jgi:hypothetical protein